MTLEFQLCITYGMTFSKGSIHFVESKIFKMESGLKSRIQAFDLFLEREIRKGKRERKGKEKSE